MLKDTFKIAQIGKTISVTVSQKIVFGNKNMDAKIRKILRGHASVSPIYPNKVERVERFMADNSFDSPVCYRIRSQSDLSKIEQDFEQI